MHATRHRDVRAATRLEISSSATRFCAAFGDDDVCEALRSARRRPGAWGGRSRSTAFAPGRRCGRDARGRAGCAASGGCRRRCRRRPSRRGAARRRSSASTRIPSTTMTGAGSIVHGRRGAVVEGEVVGRPLDGLPSRSASMCAHEQLDLEGVGVVVVHLLALLERQMPLRAVVVVLLEEHAGARRERLEDGAGDRALARARPPAMPRTSRFRGALLRFARVRRQRRARARRRGASIDVAPREDDDQVGSPAARSGAGKPERGGARARAAALPSMTSPELRYARGHRRSRCLARSRRRHLRRRPRALERALERCRPRALGERRPSGRVARPQRHARATAPSPGRFALSAPTRLPRASSSADAHARPVASPPPPKGARTTSVRVRARASISKPSEPPLPATTSASSYGETKRRRPSAVAIARASPRRRRSELSGSTTTSPRSARCVSRFARGSRFGTTTVASKPRTFGGVSDASAVVARARRDDARAPRARRASRGAKSAPRTLKLPVTCSDSSASHTRVRPRAASASDERTSDTRRPASGKRVPERTSRSSSRLASGRSRVGSRLLRTGARRTSHLPHLRPLP